MDNPQQLGALALHKFSGVPHDTRASDRVDRQCDRLLCMRESIPVCLCLPERTRELVAGFQVIDPGSLRLFLAIIPPSTIPVLLAAANFPDLAPWPSA